MISYLNRRISRRISDPNFAKEWKNSELDYIISRDIIKNYIEIKCLTCKKKIKYIVIKKSEGFY